MKWVALYVGLVACAAATGAMAEDAKPPTDPPAVNLTGTWRIIATRVGGFNTGVDNRGENPSSCTFQQAGNLLRGTCKTISVQGPISGTISGQKVEWRWLYNDGGVGVLHAFAVAVFEATLSSDDRIGGGFTNYPTLDKFNPSFEYKQTFKYIRPTRFTATRQPADPS